MDDARFDALAKRLATGVSRRDVLRGLASLTGVGLFSFAGRGDAGAQDCASRCERLPAGTAQDQCQAACAAADQARADGEAARAEARPPPTRPGRKPRPPRMRLGQRRRPRPTRRGREAKRCGPAAATKAVCAAAVRR